MDDDLERLSRDELVEEVKRLRAGIREHRDSSGHDLCWHHPDLWGLLPERVRPEIAVPPWPKFLRGCVKYREALDRELPDAPVADVELQASLGSDGQGCLAHNSSQEPTADLASLGREAAQRPSPLTDQYLQVDIDLLSSSTGWLLERIIGTRPDQFDDQTPCDDWDARALIDHVIVGGHRFAATARGQLDAFVQPKPFVEDAVRAYSRARDDLIESFGRPDALERVVRGRVGEYPGAVHAAIICIDHLVHGWDLAVATGQDETMPSDIAQAAWSAFNVDIPDDVRAFFDGFRDPSGKDGAFKPSVDVASDARPQDLLVAYFGRRPVP